MLWSCSVFGREPDTRGGVDCAPLYLLSSRYSSIDPKAWCPKISFFYMNANFWSYKSLGRDLCLVGELTNGECKTGLVVGEQYMVILNILLASL